MELESDILQMIIEEKRAKLESERLLNESAKRAAAILEQKNREYANKVENVYSYLPLCARTFTNCLVIPRFDHGLDLAIYPLVFVPQVFWCIGVAISK